MKQNRHQNIMFEAALKPIDTDPVDLLFFRPVGYRCALFFHKLGLLPNTITVVSILLGISSGFFLYFEDIWYNIIGILLLFCTHLLDCTDGQLARMIGRYSRLGRILDHLSGCAWSVSVYMALCEILGISLNEFIAGEDIEPAEVVQKSEENLIQVTEDGEHRKSKLKKIIVLLAVFGSVMAGILIYLLTFKNQPRVNYIEPLAQDSTEMNIAGMLSDADGAFLYDYAVDKEIKGISFELAVYKKGVLESESSLGTISWSELEQISLRNGMIAVIPDFQNFKVKLIVAGEGTKFSTEFNILEDVQGRNYYGRSAKSIDEGKITIQPGKEIGILALYYAKNALSVTPFSDIENVDSCNDEVYYLTVKFEKDDDALN